MSASASKAKASAAKVAPKAGSEERVAFLEAEKDETWMEYDHGKLPWYVAAVWLCALIGFGAYMVTYAVPDLGAWGSP